MKGVIVAAGLGHRLSPLRLRCPKPLVPVLDRPLIDYTIQAFVRAGFKQVGVVLGHNGKMLAHHLNNGTDYGIPVSCLRNEQYRRGNASSVYAGRAFVGNEPFVLSVADHLISPQILAAVLSHSADEHMLCVDRQMRGGPALEDATKVWLDGDGLVQRIGKRLKRWHAVDVGVFLFQPRVFGYIEDLLEGPNGACSITCLARRMIACGDELHTCDISGAFWLDVDTPDDLVYARRVLGLGARLTQLELAA